MVKVAMLSYAHVHAKKYTDQVRANGRAEIVAIWDEDEGRGKRASESTKPPSTPTSTRCLVSMWTLWWSIP